MKKSLITLLIVALVVLSPIIGMAIGKTRDLILGLAPEDAILHLADEIDQQRLISEQTQQENDRKIEELQMLVVEQKDKIEEQQQMIEDQKQINILNEKVQECQDLKRTAPGCSDEKYSLSLDLFLKKMEKENPPAMENDDVVAAAKKDWNTCQSFYKEYSDLGCN